MTLVDAFPVTPRGRLPKTEDEREKFGYEIEQSLLEEEAKNYFGPGTEQKYQEHLRTRNKEMLYDWYVDRYLESEERTQREESYREFYVKIVGRQPEKYKPMPLRIDELLRRRQKYKHSFRYFFARLFRPNTLLICSDRVLESVMQVYSEFLEVLEDSDKAAYAQAKERLLLKKQDLCVRWNAFRTRCEAKIEQARAVRGGRQKVAREMIETEESWNAYLLGVRTGLEYENAIYRVLVDMGYDCCQTKVSGDQGVDLVLRLKERKIAIQCKYYSRPVGNAAVQEVFAGKSMYDCGEAWVMTNSTYTTGAEDLARITGVKLLRHTDLALMLFKDGEGLPILPKDIPTTMNRSTDRPKKKKPYVRRKYIH